MPRRNCIDRIGSTDCRVAKRRIFDSTCRRIDPLQEALARSLSHSTGSKLVLLDGMALESVRRRDQRWTIRFVCLYSSSTRGSSDHHVVYSEHPSIFAGRELARPLSRDMTLVRRDGSLPRWYGRLTFTTTRLTLSQYKAGISF